MTITGIMKDVPKELIGKVSIQSHQAKRTWHCPIIYDKKERTWFVLSRWYGNNNKSLELAHLKDNQNIWERSKVFPRLPKGHTLLKEIEKKKHKIEVRNHILERRNQ